MGYRMRTANWSITEWVEWDGSKLRPNWNAPVGVELYDHTSDDGKSFFEMIKMCGACVVTQPVLLCALSAFTFLS